MQRLLTAKAGQRLYRTGLVLAALWCAACLVGAVIVYLNMKPTLTEAGLAPLLAPPPEGVLPDRRGFLVRNPDGSVVQEPTLASLPEDVDPDDFMVLMRNPNGRVVTIPVADNPYDALGKGFHKATLKDIQLEINTQENARNTTSAAVVLLGVAPLLMLLAIERWVHWLRSP